MHDPRAEAARWWEQAVDDRLFVLTMAQEARFFDKACFIAQQAAEKAVNSPLDYGMASNLADQLVRSVRGGHQAARAREKLNRDRIDAHQRWHKARTETKNASSSLPLTPVSRSPDTPFHPRETASREPRQPAVTPSGSAPAAEQPGRGAIVTRWMAKTQPPDTALMDRKPFVGYYSNRRFAFLPEVGSDELTPTARRAGAKLIVLDSRLLEDRPLLTLLYGPLPRRLQAIWEYDHGQASFVRILEIQPTAER